MMDRGNRQVECGVQCELRKAKNGDLGKDSRIAMDKTAEYTKKNREDIYRNNLKDSENNKKDQN